MGSWETIGATDEWYTPAYIFDALGTEFDLDVAAPNNGPRHVPTSRWLSTNALDRDWEGFVWMNPPYGGRNSLRPWLKKFFAHGNGIALVPDRTSAPWFQENMHKADLLLFVREKIKFERPDGSVGRQPGSGSVLAGSGVRAATILSLAAPALGLATNPICEAAG